MVADHARRSRFTALIGALSVIFAAALSTGCGGDNSTSSSDASIDATKPEAGFACVPGASIACSGPQQCAGYQV